MGSEQDKPRYCKRLIEVDLPIREVSAHSRREKSVRHGHVSTLHIWWARKPLAASRAEALAALLPDPADPQCPAEFVRFCAAKLNELRNVSGGKACDPNDPIGVRFALLSFVGRFSNWDLIGDENHLHVARALIEGAHSALGGEPGTRPVVLDPFVGGGSLPLEALRIGAEAYGSDVNPVAVVISSMLLECIPRFGKKLGTAVSHWGGIVRERAEKLLSSFYPLGVEGETPLVYLWFRTISCEGPSCGAEIPLTTKFWLDRGKNEVVALWPKHSVGSKRVEFEILRTSPSRALHKPTVARGAATCLACGYTVPVEQVRQQLSRVRGGASSARLMAVVASDPRTGAKVYRTPLETDTAAIEAAAVQAGLLQGQRLGAISLLPDEPLPSDGTLGFRVQKYGMKVWADLFSPRQLLALSTFASLVREIRTEVLLATDDPKFSDAVVTALSLAIDRCADYWSSLARYAGSFVGNTFSRGALPICWDFAEAAPFSDSSGNWSGAIDWIARVIEHEASGATSPGRAMLASATAIPLPDDSVDLVLTDPPYFDAVPYGDLADFFYVWMKRTIGHVYPDLFQWVVAPKRLECVVNPGKIPDGTVRDAAHFSKLMSSALRDARRVVRPDGIAVVIFAHKSTDGWEAQLAAMIEAGWTVTASWPIDTERPGRLRAQNSAALASSVHLVCRPREDTDELRREAKVGDWREVLLELPERIAEWMPRLASEGIVGADAIFACLGPALEVFSRYSSVEKASGEKVVLREYLGEVWSAVARQALSMIFADANVSGFESDARLTAMWLWTVAEPGAENYESSVDEETGDDEGLEIADSRVRSGGFLMEYDSARKIAQGLGIQLEELSGSVVIQGQTARLRSVAERRDYLMGRTGSQSHPARSRKAQMNLALPSNEEQQVGGDGELGPIAPGSTVLERVHQSMLLFADNRTAALKSFLDNGVGNDERFWRLAQALSALYPAKTEERRWVEGVLAKKKSLGF